MFDLDLAVLRYGDVYACPAAPHDERTKSEYPKVETISKRCMAKQKECFKRTEPSRCFEFSALGVHLGLFRISCCEFRSCFISSLAARNQDGGTTIMSWASIHCGSWPPVNSRSSRELGG